MPNAWSTRNTAGSPASPTTRATSAFSATAPARSSPNGFSTAIRLPAGSPAVPSDVSACGNAAGGSAR